MGAGGSAQDPMPWREEQDHLLCLCRGAADTVPPGAENTITSKLKARDKIWQQLINSAERQVHALLEENPDN